MAFISEYIPDEDKRKHNMTSSSNFYRGGTVSWTVDRERDMFLLPRAGGGPEGTHRVTDWAFYWRGHLLDVRLFSIDSGGDPDGGGHGWEHKRVVSVGGLPEELQSQKAQVIADLKDALTAQMGLGVYSRRTSYEVTLDE